MRTYATYVDYLVSLVADVTDGYTREVHAQQVRAALDGQPGAMLRRLIATSRSPTPQAGSRKTALAEAHRADRSHTRLAIWAPVKNAP